MLRTYSTCSYPGYQDTTTYAALLARRSESYGGRDLSARSSDLNPLDYGIWGILKAKVYSIRPQTFLYLKTQLDQEVASLGANQVLLR